MLKIGILCELVSLKVSSLESKFLTQIIRMTKTEYHTVCYPLLLPSQAFWSMPLLGALNYRVNFQNFASALLVLLRIATTDNW